MQEKMSSMFVKVENIDEYKVLEIPTNQYSDPELFNLLLLKSEQHEPNFRDVMKEFEVETVLNFSIFQNCVHI